MYHLTLVGTGINICTAAMLSPVHIQEMIGGY